MALQNKLGITDSTELARAEERISKKNAAVMFENGFFDRLNAGTFESLSQIHYRLFSEVYDFPGELREGNGRSMRVWLDLMLKSSLGRVVDWSRVDKDDYLLAMERSPIKDIEIKHLLKNALTDEINDREMYMKGIDHSYYYEGYSVYKTAEL